MGSVVRVRARGEGLPARREQAPERHVAAGHVEGLHGDTGERRVEAEQLVLGHVHRVDPAVGVHGEVVLHRGAPAELPLLDERAAHLGRRRRREIGLVHARGERRNGRRGVVGGAVQLRNRRAQLRREQRPHAPHQREHLLPLPVLALEARGRVALLVTVGALAHELFALGRVADAREEQAEPAVGGELGRERGGVGLGLEGELEVEARAAGSRRDARLPEVAPADAPHAHRERPRRGESRQLEAPAVAREDRGRANRVAVGDRHHRAGERSAGCAGDAAGDVHRGGRGRRRGAGGRAGAERGGDGEPRERRAGHGTSRTARG